MEPQALHRFQDRFLRQTHALRGLPHHPGLLPLVDAGVEKGLAFLTFPVIPDAHSLCSAGTNPLSVQETLTIIQAGGQALAHAHEHHLVHGALTHASLFRLPETAQTPIVVAGVGLRNMVEVAGLGAEDPPHAHVRSIWGTFLGEPSLLAPECVLGYAPDEQSDIYALGLIGATLLTGQRL